MMSTPSSVPQIHPVTSDTKCRSGTVTKSAIVPSGTANAKRKRGKKLARNQAGPQTRPVSAYTPK